MRSRGPVVAQTPPPSPCVAVSGRPGSTRESVAFAGDSRRSSSVVVGVGAACHAEGRGFESHQPLVLTAPGTARQVAIRGERFVGVENFREWRSNYPAPRPSSFERREGERISGSRRSRSAMTRVQGCSGSASSSSEGTRSRVSRSTSPTAGSRQSGGRNGGPRHSLLVSGAADRRR
jgi:hypothetical protein